MNKLLNMVKIQMFYIVYSLFNHDIRINLSLIGELPPLARWVSSVAGHVVTSAVG
jgi:hypothetical protein